MFRYCRYNGSDRGGIKSLCVHRVYIQVRVCVTVLGRNRQQTCGTVTSEAIQIEASARWK